MTIVKHADIRVLGFCNRGAREFFERHNLDWSSFVSNGIDEDVLLALNDEMATQAVEQAHKREETEGGDQ